MSTVHSKVPPVAVVVKVVIVPRLPLGPLRRMNVVGASPPGEYLMVYVLPTSALLGASLISTAKTEATSAAPARTVEKKRMVTVGIRMLLLRVLETVRVWRNGLTTVDKPGDSRSDAGCEVKKGEGERACEEQIMSERWEEEEKEGARKGSLDRKEVMGKNGANRGSGTDLV